MSQEFFLIQSPFASANNQKYVISKSPSDSDYLLFENEESIRSFHSKDEADKEGRALSFLADLRFLLHTLSDDDAVLLNSAESDLGSAEVGGVKLLSDEMVLSSQQFAVHEILDGCSDDGLRAEIYRAIDQLVEMPGVQGSACLMFTVMLELDSGFEGEAAVGNYLCSFQFGGERNQDLQGLQVRQLNNNYELDKSGRTLMNCLYDVIQSPEHWVILESMDDLPDCVDVIQRMPLLQQALPRLSPNFRGYITENGPVLRHLADRKPWLVETDNDGLPVAMRIVRVQGSDPVNDEGLRRDNQALAAAFIRDSLEEHGRERLKSARGELESSVGVPKGALGSKSAPEAFFNQDAADSSFGR